MYRQTSNEQDLRGNQEVKEEIEKIEDRNASMVAERSTDEYLCKVAEKGGLPTLTFGHVVRAHVN
jgi:hypothetical protein